MEGCFLQKAALKAFLTEFYADKASSISRKDFTLYMVLGWFVIFHARRMGEEALLGLVAEGSGIPGLQLIAHEERVPWRVRLHDRCTVHYEAHALALRCAAGS